MFCRLVNNAAVDVVGSYKNKFHPSLYPSFVECPSEVKVGWVYDADADTWSAPPAVEPEDESNSEEP
jgi:hypothetical protein